MSQETCASRRRRLMERLGSDAIAILPSGREQVRNRDVHYPFRQDSDFYYLTGFPEPESLAVLIPGRPQGEYVLLCRPRNPEMETWHGRRVGHEKAAEAYLADEADSIETAGDKLPALLENRRRLYYGFGRDPVLDREVTEWLSRTRKRSREGIRAPAEIVDLQEVVHEMRLRKGSEEIELMRRAASVSAEAHLQAMRSVRPGMYEYELEAEFLHVFRRHGCEPAYPSIVGGGANACILHYTENNARLRDGDLVLIDAGAEFRCYASDITRTFPVNGRFTGEQRAVYELVLQAQTASVEAVRAGAHWNLPHERSVRILTEGLVDLGILQGDVDALIEDEKYRPFYMHRTGHWLGLDVHDVGEYGHEGAWRTLEPGNVLTIEPGLYIAAGSEDVDERWWNIGVRIEDDVLVNESGREVLSAAVPKDPDEIEALIAAAGSRLK